MYKKFLTIFLIAATSLIAVSSIHKPTEQRTPLPSSSIISFTVHQTLKSGDNIVYESTLAAYPNETAYDLLARTQQVETKQYPFGKLVTKINGLSNGTDNKYWTYFINNQEASSSADSYRLKPNDVVLWKFNNQP